MNSTLRNILAVIAGWFIGSLLNMGLIQMGFSTFPIDGLDPNDMAAYAKIMPTLSPKYFLFPFLGHALGTLAGALVAGFIAVKNKMNISLTVGFLFLLGGIMVNYMLSGPIWFTIVDIAFAYIPMAWFGGTIAEKQNSSK